MANKLDSLSMNLENTNKKELMRVFPECFAEGKLDIDKLLSLCGEYITDDFEKYEFKWKGKSECMRLAQKRSTATLRPCPEESVNFDTTQNLYIEGDNLEVLKLLQKSYFRKVKMIYIDPPYNTGNDFVYQDDYADPLTRYKEITQQTTKSNPETMGRYHTNWLNMMYPRLRLATNLLRDDGVIFISINDNEIENLKKLCNEVFGEENFIAQLIWQQRKGGGNDSRFVAVDHEYILVYGKAINSIGDRWRIAQTKEYLKRYKEEDETGKYYWDTLVRNGLQNPIVVSIQAPDGTQLMINSQKSKETILEGLKDGTIKFTQTTNGWSLHHKVYMKSGQVLRSLLTEYGNNRSAADEIQKLFGEVLFDYAKPSSLIKLLLQLNTNNDDLILDFFSGSATTAHAVMQLNAEDGGNRQFIMVQLPELCDEKSAAYKAGYKNICEIGKERIRRAGNKIYDADDRQITLDGVKPLVDVGFKVLKLDSSNLKLWDDTPIENDDIHPLLERLAGHIDGLKVDRSETDLVYEILLKMGYALTAEVTAVELDKSTFYTVENNDMLICLQRDVTVEDVENLITYRPKKIVLAESSFADNSVLSNVHYLLENQGIELKII